MGDHDDTQSEILEEAERGEEEGVDEDSQYCLSDEESEVEYKWSEVTGTASFKSENVTAESIDVAGTIIKQLNITTASGIVEPVQLSPRHFRTWTPEDLDRCKAELIFEPWDVEELRRSLEETRVLVLSGDPEEGKGSTALLVGARLRETLRLKGVLSCQRLDALVQVDLNRTASGGSFRGQVLLFEDALAGENSDLKAFLRSVDSVRLATLAERLKKNGSAVVFTVATHTIVEHEKRLENLGILKRAAPPSQDLILGALRHFVDRLPLVGEQADSMAAFLSEYEEHLAVQLKTIPRVARFVHEYLGEVAAGNLTLRQAFSRMDDLSQWLTNDLVGDLDAQAAVLALTLGSAVPPASGIPWFPFDHLRRRITELLRTELRLPEDEPRSPAGLGRAVFLERARAHVVAMPSPLPDLVRFRDDRYPQQLWQALLGPAREFAALLLPLLQDLTLDSDLFLRSMAASSLGRLSQISPGSLATSILQQWARGRSTPEDLLGFFVQGVVASEEKNYRDFCLGALRNLAFEDDAEVAEVAVHSLRFLGRPDLALPVRELCIIARARLPIQTERLRLVEREVVAAEEEIRRGANSRRVSGELRALHAKSQIIMIAALVPEERIRLLGAIQYSLAGVLFSQGGDPGPVLRELTSWMKSEPAKIAPLCAYLFLHRRGLIDLLDRHKWISGSFGTEASSRFLLSASRGPENAEVLREFLVTIFQALQVFPGLFRFILEQRFLQIMKSWSQESCKVVGLRPVVAGLLFSLLGSENAYLGKMIEHLLRGDPQFTARGSRLRALAVDALNGEGREPVPISRPRRLPAWLEKREGQTG